MSAITQVSREVGPDGVRRYRTTWKVLVQSHQYPEVTDLSQSVVSIQSSKNTKTVGSLSLACTGDRNLLNLVFPDDYINVYCDRGDGQGWTRVFFGFVDHIDETRLVDGTSGKPNTSYNLQCSDFQKAFDRTEIYFNPYVAARNDFSSGAFGTPNVGSASLRMRGLRITGSPPDLVLNSVLLLMGFGAQFLLPASFTPLRLDQVRAERVNLILKRVSADVKNEVMLEGYAAFLEKIKNRLNITSSLDSLIDPESGYTPTVDPNDRERFRDAASRALFRGATANNFTGEEAFTILNTTTSSYAPTLLDIVDIFSFVERGAMDGYTTQMSMWSKQASVISFLRSISNEIVNELFLDLRPVSRDGGLTSGSDYSRSQDELHGNVAEGDVANGIQYVPALVMREYPFSTIKEIDASNVPITLSGQPQGGGVGAPQFIGLLQFGAIFSHTPNVPGRHVITIDGINPEDLALGASTPASKHLDVAVVHDSEITNSRLSRSDTDHFNLFELISESALLGEATKFFMMDLLPIITPTHIMRHGLRTRKLSTRFARFSPASVNHLSPAPTVDQTLASVEPVEQEDVPPLVPRVPQGKGIYLHDMHYVHRDVSTTLISNMSNAGIRFVCCHYSYANAMRTLMEAGFKVWVFAGPTEFSPTRWRATLAKQIATAKEVGCNNIIVDPENGWQTSARRVLSAWSDLGDELVKAQDAGISVVATTHGGLRARMGRYVASKIAERGGCISPQLYDTMVGAPANYAATQIPLWERSMHGCVLAPSLGVFGQNSTVVAASPPGTDEEDPTFVSAEDAGTWNALKSKRRSLVHALENARAAIVYPQYTATWGAGILWPDIIPDAAGWDIINSWSVAFAGPLVPQTTTAHTATEAAVPELLVIPTVVNIAPITTAESAVPEAEPLELQNARAGSVDNPPVRRLLARWALLNDHWYQHNLEYLSGTIEMRGAPEIRVGYRLDLYDRHMSAYVESVTHAWTYGQPMTTTLHVTRAQPNDPFPGYVVPYLTGFAPSNTQRQIGSRLASFFIVPDPLSVSRSLKINTARSTLIEPAIYRRSHDMNDVDMPESSGTLGDKYHEVIIEASTGDVDPGFEDRLRRAEELSLGLRGAGALTTSGVTATPAFDPEAYLGTEPGRLAELLDASNRILE